MEEAELEPPGFHGCPNPYKYGTGVWRRYRLEILTCKSSGQGVFFFLINANSFYCNLKNIGRHIIIRKNKS